MKRTLASALAAAAATASVAYAASVVLSGDSLGAGMTAVAACDADGFGAAYTTASGNVSSVTVTGIADPGCEGGQLSVTLTGAGTTGSGGPVAVPVDGDTADDSVVVPLSPQPDGELVTTLHVSVIGP